MIYGIGTDICHVNRIAQAYASYGERFVKRILTKNEQAAFLNAPNATHFLAKRFAMKEAVSKALGTGIGEKLSFQDIEISRQDGQRPQVLLKQNNFAHLTLHISVSDEENYAIAYAIAEHIQK